MSAATTRQVETVLLPPQRAIRHIWKILNAEARGKVDTTLALSAILHSAMRGLTRRTP